jgi:hypothetical protein
VAGLSSVSPASGGVFGGSKVTIRGKNLTSVTSVNFGGAPATDFTANSDTSLTVTTPISAAGVGRVPVTLLNPGGTSLITAQSWFTYVDPKVGTISPTSGPAAGGTSIVLFGSGLAGVTGLTFGGANAASFSVVSDRQLLATAPPASSGAGKVALALTGPGGAVESLQQTFTFMPPKLSLVSPNNGPLVGGTKVTIRGSLLTGASNVTFGGVSANSFSVISDAMITAVAPARNGPGPVAITVVTPSGPTPPVKAGQFTYLPPSVVSLNVRKGPLAGGTALTIRGRNFTGVTGVRFGSVAAASFNFVNDTTLTAVSPATTAAGPIDVIITTAGGASATAKSDQFTYIAPKATH